VKWSRTRSSPSLIKEVIERVKWSKSSPSPTKEAIERVKWSRSSPSMIVLDNEKGNKGMLHQKRVRQRRRSLTD